MTRNNRGRAAARISLAGAAGLATATVATALHAPPGHDVPFAASAELHSHLAPGLVVPFGWTALIVAGIAAVATWTLINSCTCVNPLYVRTNEKDRDRWPIFNGEATPATYSVLIPQDLPVALAQPRKQTYKLS